ncbi:MAG TPA: GreA/GreB family elongation factor [Chthoniobacterales bacterium]
MDAELQALIDAGKLTLKDTTLLERLRPGTYCFHRSWGFGRVKQWNLLVNQVIIDFQSKKEHPMQIQYAAENLQPLPGSHIFVQKTLRGPELRALAKENPTELLKIVVGSFDGKVTQDQLQKALAPDVVTEGEFKKWWDHAKKVVRKSGHFTLPAKKTEPITVRDQSVSLQMELLQSFRNARQLKEQNAQLDQILKNLDVFSDEELQGVFKQLEEIASRNLRLNPVAVMEMLLTRDEIAGQRQGLQVGTLTVAQILQEQAGKLSELVTQVATAKQRALLNQVPQAFPDSWTDRLLKILPMVSHRVVTDVARLLEEAGQADVFHHYLDRTLREHSITSEVLYWLCRERTSPRYRDLVQPTLLAAIVSAIERDQFSDARKGSKLHDLLLDDRELIPDLLLNAPSSQARDLMRRMMITPAFEELNKRSLLARMIRVHPELQNMLTGDSEQQDEALVVSWTSLQKRKDEYDDLIARKIPENTKEISVARSYGDLRENFEYKAAKEMQTVLMRRKAELEDMLARARGANFENADTSQVSIGTTVTLRDPADGEEVTYHLLGAWDSDPEKRIISYQTAIAQALLAKKPGDLVQLPSEAGTRAMELVSIVPCTAVDEVAPMPGLTR